VQPDLIVQSRTGKQTQKSGTQHRQVSGPLAQCLGVKTAVLSYSQPTSVLRYVIDKYRAVA
jgi:hypothetical protein